MICLLKYTSFECVWDKNFTFLTDNLDVKLEAPSKSDESKESEGSESGNDGEGSEGGDDGEGSETISDKELNEALENTSNKGNGTDKKVELTEPQKKQLQNSSTTKQIYIIIIVNIQYLFF